MAAGSECASGAVCVGKDTSRRCEKRMEEGESCGVDSFTVCKKEASCRNNTGRKRFVKVGGSCLAAGSECESGAVCTGAKSSKRCVKRMRGGESCGREPLWVGVKGLDCRSGTCRKGFVKVGASCVAEGCECEAGTVCAGINSSKRCVKARQKGERCGTDACWVCDSNLCCFYNVCKSYEDGV